MRSVYRGQILESKNRILSLDLLRIVACFNVILLHISAGYVVVMEDYPLPFAMNSWQAGNVFDSLTRSAVPCCNQDTAVLHPAGHPENCVTPQRAMMHSPIVG
jgi:hypothetical protein